MSPRKKKVIQPEIKPVEEELINVDELIEESLKKTEDKPEVKTEEPKKGFTKKVLTVEATEEEQKPKATFIPIEEPSVAIDAFKVIRPNMNYQYRWCHESKTSNGRSGMWVVVDKTHPDFKGMSVPIDHATDKTFFKYRDVVLCCVRKETAVKKRQQRFDRNRAKSRSMERKFNDDVSKIKKSLGNRSEAIRVMDKIEEEEKYG